MKKSFFFKSISYKYQFFFIISRNLNENDNIKPVDAIRMVKPSIDMDFSGLKRLTKKSIVVVNKKNNINPDIPAKIGFSTYFL